MCQLRVSHASANSGFTQRRTGVWAAFVVGAEEEGEERAPAELEANAVTLSHCFAPGTSFSETIMHACHLLINRAAFCIENTPCPGKTS